MEWVPFLSRKLVVIKNGIDAPEFLARSAARKKLPTSTKHTWIGMLAELHPTKRVIDAIYALAELKEEYPDVALYVLGEGSERTHLEEVITRFNMSDSVFLVGFVPEAPTLLKAFDMFLMPSRTEALSYALVEAGYAGLPSIASRVGGMPEIIRHKDTGLLTPPENPHTLARAIRSLLDDPAYATALGEKLKVTTTERFNKETMLTETLKQYS
jgi:glycosyltransferase involved in cell wall biosynthesis